MICRETSSKDLIHSFMAPQNEMYLKDADNALSTEDEGSRIYRNFKSTSTLSLNEKLYASETVRRKLQIDSKQKTYTCSFCSQTFSQLFSLRRHEKFHLGERPFTCEECDKSFTTLSNLRQHQQVHQEIDNRKRFECIHCSKSYNYQCNLKKHIKSHQKNKNVTVNQLSLHLKKRNSECEPLIRKQLHYQAANAEVISTDCSNSKLESSSYPETIIESSEARFEENKTVINSLTAALRLSLLKEKLNVLDKLYQLKTRQLEKLTSIQGGSMEVPSDLDQKAENEKRLIKSQSFSEIPSIYTSSQNNLGNWGTKTPDDFGRASTFVCNQSYHLQIKEEEEQNAIQLDQDISDDKDACFPRAVVDYNILERDISNLGQPFGFEDAKDDSENYFNSIATSNKGKNLEDFNPGLVEEEDASVLEFFD